MSILHWNKTRNVPSRPTYLHYVFLISVSLHYVRSPTNITMYTFLVLIIIEVDIYFVTVFCSIPLERY